MKRRVVVLLSLILIVASCGGSSGASSEEVPFTDFDIGGFSIQLPEDSRLRETLDTSDLVEWHTCEVAHGGAWPGDPYAPQLSYSLYGSDCTFNEEFPSASLVTSVDQIKTNERVRLENIEESTNAIGKVTRYDLECDRCKPYSVGGPEAPDDYDPCAEENAHTQSMQNWLKMHSTR